MELKTSSKNVQQFTQLNAEEQIDFINNKIKSYQNESKRLADCTLVESKSIPTPKNAPVIIEKRLNENEGLNTLLEELGELALSHAKKADSFDQIECFLTPLILAFKGIHPNAKARYNEDDLIASPLFSKLLENPYRKLFFAFYQPKFYDSLIQYLFKNLKHKKIKGSLFFSILLTCLLFNKNASKQFEMTSLDFDNFIHYLPQFDFKKSTDTEILNIFNHIRIFLLNCYFTRNNLVDLCKLMQKHVVLSPKELSRVDNLDDKTILICRLLFERVLRNISFKESLTQEETNALSNLLFNKNMESFILHTYFNDKPTELPLILSRFNYIVPDYFFYEKDEDVEIHNYNIYTKSLIKIANNYYQHNNSHNFQLNLLAKKMFKNEMSFIDSILMYKKPFYQFQKEILSVKDLMSLEHSKNLLNVFNAQTLSVFYLRIIDKVQREINSKIFFNRIDHLLKNPNKRKKGKKETHITLIFKHLFYFLFKKHWQSSYLSNSELFQVVLIFYLGLKITVDKINRKQFDDPFVMTNTQNERKIVDFFNHLNGILSYFENVKEDSIPISLEEYRKLVVQEKNEHNS